jgi:hypothetical protein
LAAWRRPTSWRSGRGSWEGATDEERDATLAGDDLIANPDFTTARANTVQTAPDQVWHWIAQLGQGRGGFYSYDMPENLVGCDIHSADRIVPEWQHMKPYLILGLGTRSSPTGCWSWSWTSACCPAASWSAPRAARR